MWNPQDDKLWSRLEEITFHCDTAIPFCAYSILFEGQMSSSDTFFDTCDSSKQHELNPSTASAPAALVSVQYFCYPNLHTSGAVSDVAYRELTTQLFIGLSYICN
jgi:hypothetical protein